MLAAVRLVMNTMRGLSCALRAEKNIFLYFIQQSFCFNILHNFFCATQWRLPVVVRGVNQDYVCTCVQF